MSLLKYKTKRRFSDTPEPEGKPGSTGNKLIFVVQRHHASHLHYDFRLELDGTLKSWAIPKGPSLNSKDKRLAMMVEDHPVDYATFEGDIPPGNYGAGHVDVWDHGTYEPIDEEGSVITPKEFSEHLKSGSIKFRMKGKLLKGDFALVKMKKDAKTWLLIKHKDQYATDEDYNSEDYAKKSSLAYTTERNKQNVVKKKVKPVLLMEHRPTIEDKKKAIHPPRRSSSNPKFANYIKPMLAKLHDSPFSDPEWVFEIKWDGYRAIAEVNRKEIKLYSRNGLSFKPDYPLVYDELNKIKKNVILDGEIVAMNAEGKPSFQLIQQYAIDQSVALCYYVFDCLYFNGKSIEDKPLVERKEILKSVLPKSDVIKYCDHITEKGKDFFAAIKQQGLEGMIAKKADSIYTEGIRSAEWLKVKNHIMEEAVIAGYTEPRNSRKYFGALVLGVYKKGKLVYIGHTGTGFNDSSLKDVYSRLQKLRIGHSPFNTAVPVNAPVTWVKPELVCNLKYSEVTEGGHRRHPVFMGLRIDKEAKEVHEEVKDTGIIKKLPNKNIAKTATMETSKRTEKVVFTHLDKIFWPDEGYTKGDVIDYYNTIYPHIIKYMKDRPESMFRTPNGIKDKGFFHKDAGTAAPPWVKSIALHSESAEKDINYILCNDRQTLLYLANLGCIEVNPWNSRLKTLDNPDYLVLDLDPSSGNTFDQVIETANVIKDILDKAGAVSFPKTSGATGIHIYVPLGAKYTYDQAKEFAHMVAQMAQETLPQFTSLERSLSKRGNKNIYIDFLQNRKGQTLACAYSLRPKPRAPVSTPLDWKEVKAGLRPTDFNIKNIMNRIEKKGDLFSGVLLKGIDMMKCIKKLS